jgi:hypothetical protein
MSSSAARTVAWSGGDSLTSFLMSSRASISPRWLGLANASTKFFASTLVSGVECCLASFAISAQALLALLRRCLVAHSAISANKDQSKTVLLSMLYRACVSIPNTRRRHAKGRRRAAPVFQVGGQRSINLIRQCFWFRPTATAFSGDTSNPHRTDSHTWCNDARRLRNYPPKLPFVRSGWVTLGSGPQPSAATARSCPFHTARIQKSEPADRGDREGTGRIRGASGGCIPGISVTRSSGTFLNLAHPPITSGALERSSRFQAVLSRL